MCNPASFIVTKSKVLWSAHTDSHTLIRLEHGIPEETAEVSGKMIKAVAVEITPGNGDLATPIEDWNLMVDQDLLPDWWDRDDANERCRHALKAWAKAKLITEGKQTRHVGEVYVTGGEVKLYGTARARLYGRSHAFMSDMADACLYDNAGATMVGGSRAWLHNESSAVLYGLSHATLYGQVKVVLRERSTATRYDPNSQVEVYDNAVCIDRVDSMDSPVNSPVGSPVCFLAPYKSILFEKGA